MAASISYLANQYTKYIGFYLKAYIAGSDPKIPTTIYYNNVEKGGAAKLKINDIGFFISAGNAKVIPHLTGFYDLFLFPSEKEADENDFTNSRLIL